MNRRTAFREQETNMRKKAKKILVSAALIMSLCMFTACGKANNAADEVDTTEDENITNENDMDDADNAAGNTADNGVNNTDRDNNAEISTDNGTVIEENNGTGNGAAEDGMTDNAAGTEDNDNGTVSGALGDGVRDLGDGVGNAVEDVGDAIGNAAEGR